MDRFHKLQNITLATLFGAVGIIALAAGLCGKTHQFTMAGICAVITLALALEIRHEERKARHKPRGSCAAR